MEGRGGTWTWTRTTPPSSRVSVHIKYLHKSSFREGDDEEIASTETPSVEEADAMGWQETTETSVTSLGLVIAAGVYGFMFALTAINVQVPRHPTKRKRQDHSPLQPPSRVRRRNQLAKQYSFTTSAQLRFAVDVWLENEELAVLRFGPISMWNVSLIEDMSSLFQDAVGFDADLSEWDTSNVRNMTALFRGAKGFRGDSIRNWNTTNVEDFSHMFENSSFSGDLTLWSTTSAKTFEDMFHNAPFFDLDLAPSDSTLGTAQSYVEFDSYTSYQEDDAWVPETAPGFGAELQTASTTNRTRLVGGPSPVMYAGFLSYGVVSFATLIVVCSRRWP